LLLLLLLLFQDKRLVFGCENAISFDFIMANACDGNSNSKRRRQTATATVAQKLA